MVKSARAVLSSKKRAYDSTDLAREELSSRQQLWESRKEKIDEEFCWELEAERKDPRE